MRKCSEMPYHIGIQIRLYPDYKQKHLIAVNCGAERFVYNRLVALNNERYTLSKYPEVPVYKDRLEYIDSILHAEGVLLPAAIKNSAPFLYGEEIDSMVPENAVRCYRAAWKKFKEDPLAGAPTFHRRGYAQSYLTNAHYHKDAEYIYDSNVRFVDKCHITLPIIKKIRFKGSSKMIRAICNRKDTRIGTIRIWTDAVGRYYASLQVASEHPFRDALPKTGSFAGIDLNVDNFLWDSNGNTVDNPKYRRSLSYKLAKAQRRASRRAERAKKESRKLSDSSNYQRARKKVALLHSRINARAEDFRHRVSKAYVESQDIIVVEDLKIKNLLQNHKLALAISECGWSSFIGKLEYKANMYGKTFLRVPPQLTTQTCSTCGYVLAKHERLSLSDREWICPKCGAYHLRDHNASKNVLLKGLAALGLVYPASWYGNSPG